jgi:radical SAM protein with 4Fe4S-binding SPASM domain
MVLMTKIKLSKHGYSILQIETYGACNMKCQFCPYPLRLDNDSLLEDKYIIDLIDAIDPYDPNFEYVTLSQFNEPLLDRRIFDFYEYLHAKGIPNFAITNGLLFNSSDIRERLASSKPTTVKISLQTINPKRFASQRGITTSPLQYFTGIAKYISSVDTSLTNIIIDLACNFISPPKRLINKLLGLSNGEPSVEASPNMLYKDLIAFIKVMREYDKRIMVDHDQISLFLEQVSTEYSESSLYLREGVELRLKPFFYGRRISDYRHYKGPIRCGNRILGILADGSVVPCCLAYDNSLALGNIKKNSLASILDERSAWLADLRDYTPLKSTICQACLGEPTRRGLLVKRLRTQLSEFKAGLKQSFIA